MWIKCENGLLYLFYCSQGRLCWDAEPVQQCYIECLANTACTVVDCL